MADVEKSSLLENESAPPTYQQNAPPSNEPPAYAPTPSTMGHGAPGYGAPGHGAPGYGAPGYGYPSGTPYGAQQQNQTTVVVAQQQPQAVVHQTVLVAPRNYYVQSHMWISIVTTICCLWPVGIIAIIFSSVSRSHFHAGDADGGRTFGRVALGINIFNILGGITVIILLFTVIIPGINSY
eukprot:m.2794 g.2794  ORF g.2794 m.2794 type:complete len:181 (+) comp8905_c0_seq1:89-631(+)